MTLLAKVESGLDTATNIIYEQLFTTAQELRARKRACMTGCNETQVSKVCHMVKWFISLLLFISFSYIVAVLFFYWEWSHADTVCCRFCACFGDT